MDDTGNTARVEGDRVDEKGEDISKNRDVLFAFKGYEILIPKTINGFGKGQTVCFCYDEMI